MAPIRNWEAEVATVVGWSNDVGPELLTVVACKAPNPEALRRAAKALGGPVFPLALPRDLYERNPTHGLLSGVERV
jgi:hypothetical protein